MEYTVSAVDFLRVLPDFAHAVLGVTNATENDSGERSTLELVLGEVEPENGENSVTYKVVATVMHVLIFIAGVMGNVVLIVVARRTRCLRTPTYCYLVSLAYADLIVLFSAVPEAILFHHIGGRWVLGQAGCSLLIFGNFLGINAGSLSILAFTIERYIAVLRPMLAQKMCTVGRAKKVIISVWIVSILYCAPWLGLTKVVPDTTNPEIELCDFRLTKEQYIYFFMTDLVLFYFVPLAICMFVYSRIAWAVRRRNNKTTVTLMHNGNRSSSDVTLDSLVVQCQYSYGGTNASVRSSSSPNRSSCRSKASKTQALPMLIVVVVLFAICWLPFRGLLVYNSLARTPWLDLWFLLFCKTLIYLNSAINPFLYNFTSRRFREAVFHFIGIRTAGGANRIKRSVRSYV